MDYIQGYKVNLQNIKSKIFDIKYRMINQEYFMKCAENLEKRIGKFKIGYVPGGFLIDYDNDNLFKDFILCLKSYLN